MVGKKKVVSIVKFRTMVKDATDEKYALEKKYMTFYRLLNFLTCGRINLTSLDLAPRDCSGINIVAKITIG